jgi:serine/threonine protein kinase
MPPTPQQTVPCQVATYRCITLADRLLTSGAQYRTGKTLGSGTYAIVKEAVHIKTGKYYACKVINKKLMEGREHMVRRHRPSARPC